MPTQSLKESELNNGSIFVQLSFDGYATGMNGCGIYGKQKDADATTAGILIRMTGIEDTKRSVTGTIRRS